ncbi:MAG: hypothetical protein WAZ30_08940 [Syntrophorhabdus sp.]
MKLLFTRLQEEVITVKRSVTRVQVETGASRIKPYKFQVIDITPEPCEKKREDAQGVSKLSSEDQKNPLSLNAKSEHVSDIVDLQGTPDKGNSLTPVIYSAGSILKGNHSREKSVDKSFLSSKTGYIQKNEPSFNKSADSVDFSMVDESLARYRFTTRKFISTQEMIEYHRAQEKRVSFELTI